ncbi:hypothetical protein [Isoptericola cucumis]|uniref:Ig-like domain-containing protein n=1 Tax=Isoptericola cucumis TaxID=1776856 RepID=A0ABQ2BAF0_9MICO|nr:hypothetical protein [Isoptericola cucumis]GGI09340.1 hypothetical protein GCM10007368_25690 [Isoptericola cucumis]
MSRRRTTTTRAAACLGAAALLLGGALATTAGSTAAVAAPENLPGVPEAGSPAKAWEKWAAQERADAKATDWEADAAARGCELQDVTITSEVDREYNLAMGAPADLETHRVELAERCDGAASLAGEVGSADGDATRSATTLAAGLPSGSQCDTTEGPGVVCLWKDSGRIYSSWRYEGSGTVTGFLRIYRVSTGSSGCPTGSTWLTGADSSWSNGTTRTVSKTRTQAGGYATHVWKKVVIGHTNWGSTCASL